MPAVRQLAVAILAWAVLGGCGFHRTSSEDGGGAGDGGGGNGGSGGAGDLAGADLLAPPAGDLGGTDGDVTSLTGPGPAGALPAGFCCSSNDDCRSRNCAGLSLAVHYCTDECDHDSLCSVWGGNLKCDVNGTGYCVAASSPATCLDPSLYRRGTKPIGSCCQSGFDKSGQECLGGRCDATGPTANPFYCTQGCDQATPCPAPYMCNSASFCSLPDPNAPYSCQ